MSSPSRHHLGQSLRDIGDEILGLFEADVEPGQSVPRPTRNDRIYHDKALITAPRGAQAKQLERLGKDASLLLRYVRRENNTEKTVGAVEVALPK